MALPQKFSEGATYAFLDRVLSRFGGPAEVLTNQGIDFLGEFQTLLEQTRLSIVTFCWWRDIMMRRVVTDPTVTTQ